MEKTVHLRMFKYAYKPRNINVVFSHCGSQQHGSTSHQKWQWRVLRGAVYPVQWMKLMMMCNGSDEDGNVRSECEEDQGTDWHWLVKLDRIWHALCIKCMQLTEKQNFLAHILFVGFILDLDKYVYFLRSHLRVFYILVNTVLSTVTMCAGERQRVLLCMAVQYCLQQGQNVRRLKLLEQHAMSTVR